MTDKEITEMNLLNAAHYGQQRQMNHFTEELAELIQAIAEEDSAHIAEEVADVEIMVEQMEHLLPLDIKYIDIWAEHFAPPNDILSCLWHLAAPIKSINKLRRVDLDVAADPHISEEEFQIQRQNAENTLETSIGELIGYLNWLEGRYNITADGIRQIKSYKVQRTRDRIELENSSICKKDIDDKAIAQAQDLSDYCKKVSCVPGICFFANEDGNCALIESGCPESWPEMISQQKQLQEEKDNG